MNKDALWATVIGFGIGLLIMGGILAGPKIVKGLSSFSLPKLSLPKLSIPMLPKVSKKTISSPSPTPLAKPLTIDSPLPEAIEVSDEVLVSGVTYPQAFIVVQDEDEDSVVTANTEGKYAAKLTLNEGKNDISVTSYKDGNNYQETVVVYYTQERF